MPQVINTNIASLNAQRNLNNSQGVLNQSLQRLSTGLRINSARDDAAGLAISERFTSQIRGLNQAIRNSNDGISLAQTAEGALSTTGDNLQRIRELALQSANATNSAEDRKAIQAEVNALQSEITRVAETTQFNGQKILDGSFTEQVFQVGANINETISVSVRASGASDLANYAISTTNATANEGTGTPATGAVDLATIGTNTIAAQTLTFNTGDGAQTLAVLNGQTAKQVAAAVNGTNGPTGISATATNTVTLDTLSAAGTVTFSLGSSGGTAKNITAVVTDNTDLTALADAINSEAGTTGVTATLGASLNSIQLKNGQGEDISIENFTHSQVAAATLDVTGASGNSVTLSEAATPATDADSTIISGTVTFNGASAFSVESSIADAAGSLFNVAATIEVNPTSTSVGDIDVGTVDGALAALAVVDSALQTISSQRASLGAVQNRFESAITNLSTTAENASAARSRVRDADFASETAALTRAQILQQAGLSVLSQANSNPQNVLALLQ